LAFVFKVVDEKTTKKSKATYKMFYQFIARINLTN